jgi:glycosyltransferase involved in cell wall biosynthesis
LISVVIPLYRSRHELPDLLARTQAVLTAMEGTWELILVDDACPDATGALAHDLPITGSVRLLELDRNLGQHAALQIGLREAQGECIALLDGDLQDRPEDLPQLCAALGPDVDVVCAGRRGHYTSPVRGLTGRLLRVVRFLLSRGRIPADAGLFLVARREAALRVLALEDPGVNLLSAFAHTGARISSEPIERAPREAGTSAYRGVVRLRVGLASLGDATPLHPILRQLRRRRWHPPNVERRKLLPSVEAGTP